MSESDNNSFILFYSNYCEYCKEFVTKLNNIDKSLYQKFNKICVDNNDNIPEGIESVPTIIVPTHNNALTDTSVFIWLDTMASQFIDKNESNNKLVKAEQKAEEVEGEIKPFIRNEMGKSFSDNFSFLDSTDMSGPLAHSFSFLDSSTDIDSSSRVENDPSDKEHQLQQMNLNMNRNLDVNMSDYNPDVQAFSRPEIQSNNSGNSFESQFDTLKNSRENDPFITMAPQRR